MSETLKRAAELLRQYGRMANTVKAYQGDETLQVAADLDRTAQAEPVAIIISDGDSYDFMVTVCGQNTITDSGAPVHLYATPRLPRDVLMAVAREVLRAAIQSCDEAGGDMGALHGIDLYAIVDQHAEQADAEPASAQPANKKLLSAMKEARESLQFANDSPYGGIQNTIWMMHRPETLFDFMDAAIAAAESAQAQEGGAA